MMTEYKIVRWKISARLFTHLNQLVRVGLGRFGLMLKLEPIPKPQFLS